MRKVVVNNSYGGFGLSDTAFEMYLDLKEITWYKDDIGSFSSFYTVPVEKYHKVFDEDLKKPVNCDRFEDSNKLILFQNDIPRDDAILVQVAEDLGDAASGAFAELLIVEIPDDVEFVIEEYDGIEWVAEKHRVWYGK
jgi:hypothetical protein